MVMKKNCWKKFTDNNTVKSWVKAGKDRKNPHLGKGKVISIFPKIGDWKNGKFVKSNKYVVEVDSGGYSLNKKTFNKKSNANKFVKLYMKKNC